MILQKDRGLIAACCIWLLMLSTDLRADEDWLRQSFDVKGVKGGKLTMVYPKYWGKAQYKGFENVTDVEFGPFGPRAKPVFMVHVQSVPMTGEITDEHLTAMTKAEVDAFSKVAFETDIPISELAGPHNSIRYFSITDKSKKWGEFDYMTMAVVATSNLLTKVYFFSSDGAPDFGSDAIRFMESIQFTAPPPKVEEEKE